AMTDTSSCGGVAADQRYEACLVLTPGLIDATGVNASVKVDDVAGNSTSTSDTTNAVVDTKVPVFTSSGLTIAVDNGVSGVAAVNGGSISADKVRVNAALAVTDGDTITWNAGPIGGGSTITNGAMVTVLAGATKNSAQFFALRVADNAGNTLLTDTNAVDGKTISVDNVIPAAPSSLVLNGGIPITSSSLMSVVLTGVTGEAGLLMVAVVGFGGYAENWSQAVTGGPFSLSPHNFTAFADGSLQVYATIQDDAGNLSSDGQTTGTKDTGVSALQNVSLNGGNLISSSQQNSVQLRFQATEAGTLTYQVENTGGGSLSQQTYTVSGGTFPRNETVSVNVSSLSDGTIRATLSFKDLVGNVTPQVSVSVAKDTVSKAVTNLKINGGDKIDHINRYMSTLTFIANELGTANYVITGPQGSPVTGTMQVTATGIQKKLGLNLSSFGISGAVTITVTFTDTPNNQGVSTVLNATIVPRF
ncbi:MAG: hypothetical protein Q8O95_00005, partial [bacterium]|nr:hypothetical protein [bacterium]